MSLTNPQDSFLLTSNAEALKFAETPMANIDPLQAARSLRELIESEADAIEEQSTMTEPVIEALHQSSLFRLSTPRCLGGLEADSSTILDVCEELSFADGSVGWAHAQNITVGAYAAYLEEEFAKPLAKARASAGMFAPLGIATEEDDGYRVSGDFMFGSGSGHAEYMGGAALLMKDGEVIPFGNGGLPVLAFIVPTERVKLNGNWDVMGLKGTGSFDFSIPDQWIARGQAFPLLGAKTLHGGSIYGIGPIPVGTISSAGWGLGVAKRALHEIVEIAKAGRARMGQIPLLEQAPFQRDLGIQTMALESVRRLLHDSYGRAIEAVGGAELPELCEDRIRETKAAATYATRVCKEVVTFAWETSGSVGIRNPSVLQRCFRDMCVGAGHMVFDDRNYTELAKRIVGLETAPF